MGERTGQSGYGAHPGHHPCPEDLTGGSPGLPLSPQGSPFAHFPLQQPLGCARHRDLLLPLPTLPGLTSHHPPCLTGCNGLSPAQGQAQACRKGKAGGCGPGRGPGAGRPRARLQSKWEWEGRPAEPSGIKGVQAAPWSLQEYAPRRALGTGGTGTLSRVLSSLPE